MRREPSFLLRIPEGFVMQRHSPDVMAHNHTHPQLEINLSLHCSLRYVFGTQHIVIPEGRLAVFSGLTPHRVMQVEGEGEIIVAYLPISSRLHWSLPPDLLKAVFDGYIVVSDASDMVEEHLMVQWFSDYCSGDSTLQAIAAQELLLRLKRLDHQGWSQLGMSSQDSDSGMLGESRRIQKMVEFIGHSYTQVIRVDDVAGAANLSPSHAMAVFKRGVGKSIGAYISELRLNLACAKLLDSQDKIAAIALEVGYSSLSSFYEAFVQRFGKTPRQYRQLHLEVG